MSEKNGYVLAIACLTCVIVALVILDAMFHLD
jgi:hypothetical protein